MPRDKCGGGAAFTGVLVAALLVAVGEGRPAEPRMATSAVAQAVDFLTKYGYLPPTDLNSGNLRTESELRKAIRIMQKFGNITQTGIIDDATLELMQRPRCGVPDLLGTSERVRRYALQGQKWPKLELSWSVKRWPKRMDTGTVRQQLTKALKVWSDASKLTFLETRNPTADIAVSFYRGYHDDGYPFDGQGSVLAHAFFPGEGIGGDAHFDEEESWVPGEPRPGSNDVNLFAVAAHEFGHSLGLSHSSLQGSLMFPYYQDIKDNFQLPYDDVVGIQQLYGARNPVHWATLPNPQPTTTTRRPARRPGGSSPSPPRPTHRPSEEAPPTPEPGVPNTCNTSFDSISVIRREVFIFKGRYFWRLDSNGLKPGYPVSIDRFWYDFPKSMQRIDAVYERPIDTKIVFFSGKQFWLFEGNKPVPGYPRLLTELGLPPSLDKIDAAMVWGHNGKTYFFSGNQYWRYDEFDGRVELDYPRKMGNWQGVPYNIDAAFQWTDGKTYFFKGRKFWMFNDIRMRVHDNMPEDTNHFWFKCPSQSQQLPVYNPVTGHGFKVTPFLWFPVLMTATTYLMLNSL